MPVTATPALPQNPKAYLSSISTGDTTNLKTLVTGGTNGTKITSLSASMSSTTNAANTIVLGITNSAVFYPLGTFAIPASAGLSTAGPSVNLLDRAYIPGLPADNDGVPYIFLGSSLDTIQARAIAATTAGTSLTFVGFGADF